MRLAFVAVTVAFISNYLWENMHAHLYAHHLGETVDQPVLLIATLGDVVILSVFALLWYYVPIFTRNLWLVIPLGLFVGYAIERYALAASRWAYAEGMPIVPYLGVGLSPFLQLAVTGLLLLLVLRWLDLSPTTARSRV